MEFLKSTMHGNGLKLSEVRAPFIYRTPIERRKSDLSLFSHDLSIVFFAGCQFLLVPITEF